MRAAALAGIGAFAGCLVIPALAAERDAMPSLKPDATFTARWDRCEAAARQRRTPPGKVGYGDFMDACLGKAASRPAPANGSEPITTHMDDAVCDAKGHRCGTTSGTAAPRSNAPR